MFTEKVANLSFSRNGCTHDIQPGRFRRRSVFTSYYSQTMNKPALLSMGKTLGEDKLYVVTIFDMEPSGIIVQAYNQADSAEYILSVSERELAAAGVTRAKDKLTYLVNTLYLSPYGTDQALQSSLDPIKEQKKRPTGDEVDAVIKAAGSAGPQGESVYDTLVTGLVELCKSKPVGLDAVTWLGEWLISNNPKKPCVDEGAEE
jgi:hypothetical protein